MKKIVFNLLVVIGLLFVTKNYAQRTVFIKNGIGITGGITNYNILTDDFETKAGQGWLVGMSATVDIPHKGYNMSYGLQIANNNVGIAARQIPVLGEVEFVDYEVLTAQLALLWHVKLGTEFVTLDLGPMIQYNGDLKIKSEDKGDYFVEGYTTVQSKDLDKLSNITATVPIGITAGIHHFKVRAQYIHGFTNVLDGLNNQPFAQKIDKKFKGNQSMLVFSLTVSF